MTAGHATSRRRQGPASVAAAAVAALGVLLAAACSGPRDGAAVVRLPQIASPGSGQARLTAAVDGTPVLSWLEAGSETESLKYATFSDGAWSEPRLVTERADLFVNWADFPSVVQLDKDLWVAHYLLRQPDSYFAYDVAYSISADGIDFGPAGILNTDGAEAEHGFVTLFDWDGDIGAVWLDGRALAAVNPSVIRHPPVGVELRAARIDRAGRVVERALIDELACDCCQTGVAVAADGPVLVYRDRTPDEIRDVVARRFVAGAWSEPQRLGADDWQIEGCPVNGPAIAADGTRVAAVWFTAADDEPLVQLAWSTDAGAAFGPAVVVDADGSFGQADVVLVGDGAVVSWWRRSADGGIAFVARHVAHDGTLGPVREVAHTELGQPVDVPQMTRAGAGLVFAWTAFDDTLQVETAYIDDWR